MATIQFPVVIVSKHASSPKTLITQSEVPETRKVTNVVLQSGAFHEGETTVYSQIR